MARNPQDIISQVSALNGIFGQTVNYSRFVESADPNRSVFATDQNGTTVPMTAQVIIEEVRRDLLPTIAGARPKETLDMLSPAGSFQIGDEVQYSGHTYVVERVDPLPYSGLVVADEVEAKRELD